VPVRVSPTDRIRHHIDELFAQDRPLPEILEEVARLGAQLLMQAALEAEVTEFLGRDRYQRAAACDDARPGSRNGFREVTVKTTAGPVGLARPKLRGTSEAFASRLFGAHVTKTNALESLVIASFVRGLSVRDVEATLAEALGDQAAISKSTVSAICGQIKDDYQAWSRRRLDQVTLDYLFLDASFFRMHPGSPAEPVLAAWGITTDGKPAFIGLAPGAGESTDAWTGFLTDLKDRGLASPLLIVSDGAPGLIAAIEQAYPKALRQRCLIHRSRKEIMRWFSVWGSMCWYGDLARGPRSAGVEVRGAAASSERAAAAVAAGGRGPVAGTRRGPGSRPVGRGEREHRPQGRLRAGGGPGSVPGRPCETRGRGPQERRRIGHGADPGAAGAG
jgi:putative transposase